MIEVVKKPIGEVARLILSYVDPNTQRNPFVLVGFNSQLEQPLTYRASLDDPTTLEGDNYAVVHGYPPENCEIKDPADPGYLGATARIAVINKNSRVPDETQVRWSLDNMQYPRHEFVYEKLEKLLQ